MRFAGDFHIHSHYSRATSRQLTPENLDLWGRRKGLAVLGTGDFTHPGWTEELRNRLVPAEEGLFVLKDEYRIPGEAEASAAEDRDGVRFVLTAEVSSIYKYGDKVRKVHNLLFAPDFDAVFAIQREIERLGGNIRSDGRPILGMDSRDLLELCLEADERNFFVPAHIWTPWFSALGSKSGFETLEECYRDLSSHITAVETGLSSDPPMNWMCSFLDKCTIISNSDAHSPEKLGREACLFDAELSYPHLVRAMSEGAEGGFRGTVELFPQEGKYHFDGHRKCGVAWDPLETLENGGICPVCGRPVTVGVLNRVAQLADRSDIAERPRRDPFHSLVPLPELLGEIEGVGPGSKRVKARYRDCLARLGSELEILLHRDEEEIEKAEGSALAEAVARMRGRRIRVEEGYDGEYGIIRVWGEGDPPPSEARSPSLFDDPSFDGSESGVGGIEGPPPLALVDFDLAAFRRTRSSGGASDSESALGTDAASESGLSPAPSALNPQQRTAAGHSGGHSLIIAGPGTGKTHTIVEKIGLLVRSGTDPGGIVAVTFANKAAKELKERLETAGLPVEGSISPSPAGTPADPGAPGDPDAFSGSGNIRVSTFHGLGLSILRPYLPLLGRDEDFQILDDREKEALLAGEGLPAAERKDLIDFASRVKSGQLPVPREGEPEYRRFRTYQELLRRNDSFDFDDLVYLPVRLFRKKPEALEAAGATMAHLVVDEYQDINPIQYALVRDLAKGAELCAVGDPNQSIYGFRGSSPEFIRRFGEDFPEARIFPLSRSYRCPETVLRASSQILGEDGEALLGGDEGPRIDVRSSPSAASEAEMIARDIEGLGGGMGFFSFDSGVTGSGREGSDGPAAAEETALSDIAVLCRTSLQMPPLEKAFFDHRIPFRTIRTESLFDAEPYRSFLNFIRIALGGESARAATLCDVEGIPRKAVAGGPVPASLRDAVSRFLGLRCESSASTGDTSGNPPDPEEAERMEGELAPYWKDGEDGKAFVVRARLGSGVDRYDRRLQAVSLMTIHAAKGLEFDAVYIPGCEDTLLPYALSGKERADEEEERRLLYVAMTRAKRRVCLSWARSRRLFGKTETMRESPFLTDIEETLVRFGESRGRPMKPDDAQMKLF